ncbi:rRNA methyltransferase 1, mitochondrial [Galdieria sulphuraria]|uniref:rRNA methyltransferase 1, mitochondrial n=1 Tax=Galdieria sulphuraria TaxID=130081 RepID=M2XKT3_GALSU|nr:RNA methyltransferase, TrmH family [Galdieria sulphuraria]EME30747.1 RNA methyltransferase, TrmH family [Galdieria sulphuraria]GJD10821.1 rRNA methyltransferase 1, mitochondrial [Galdieria sulphuraria]|eukprot:XP_005707267.1 RNA methyltransferase, TrmH family [Galdieria sulphuraria]
MCLLCNCNKLSFLNATNRIFLERLKFSNLAKKARTPSVPCRRWHAKTNSAPRAGKGAIWEHKDKSPILSETDSTLSSLQKAMKSGDDFIYGVTPVYAALTVKTRNPIRCLYLQENADFSKRKDAALLQKIVQLAEEANIPSKTLNKGDLNNLSGQRPHQGIILQAAPLQLEYIEQLPSTGLSPDEAAPIWLALDEVMDPQNLGSLLRTACFLGITGVAICDKNSAPLTGTVSKASAGAMELMTIHAVRNMSRFLQNSQRQGWYILGASMEKETVNIENIHPSVPVVLVLGSEGFGLRTNVQNVCNGFVAIQQRISTSCNNNVALSLIDSLNVGVAGGILMEQLRASRDN